MSSENQMRKSGVNNMNQMNFGNNGTAGQQNPPMSPDNVSQPMGAMVGKRQSQHVNSVGMNNNGQDYNTYQNAEGMRASRD